MLRKICLCMALAMISMLVTSCGSSDTKTDTVSATPTTVTVTEEDDSTTVDLIKGDTLVVELSGNPTTGYQWEQIGSDTAILQQVGEPEFTPDSSATGSPGKVQLRFEAMGQGEMELQLAYQRSFEPETPPTETFKIDVAVR